MKRIFLIHQWSGNPNGDWMPWLKSQLEKLDYQVFTPEMPDTDVPIIDKWVNKLSEVIGTPDKDTYFVGHSIGCQTILRYLDSYRFKPQEKIGGAVFVAGWFNLKNLDDEETEKIAKPWIKTPINLNKIKTVLPKSTLIISDNDPFNYFEENKQKFAQIVTKSVVMPNAGHISGDYGFDELPEVLYELINLLK